MKKFGLSLGLILFLVCCGWQDVRFGTAPAAAEHPRAQGQYYCDPYYQQCTYNNYYSAPYADPLTQFFYYSVPYGSGQYRREHPRRFDHPRRDRRRHDHPR